MLVVNAEFITRAESLSGTGIIQASDLQPAEVENPSPAFSEREAGGNSELQSPVSVLSHGLSKHVIADQSKRIPWPNILSRLRQAFYLDPQHVPGEQEMVAMQAVIMRPSSKKYFISLII